MYKDSKASNRRLSLGWLELLLCAATVALFFQAFPELRRETLSALDLSEWSRGGMILVTAAALLMLVGIRFVPHLSAQYRQRIEQRAKQQIEEARIRVLREQRETLQRLKEGMKRRMY